MKLFLLLTTTISSLISSFIPHQPPRPTSIPTPMAIPTLYLITNTPSSKPLAKATLRPRPTATPTDNGHRPNAPTICVENCGPSYTPQTPDIYKLTGPKGNIKVIFHPQENCVDKNKVVELHSMYPHMLVFENKTKNSTYLTTTANEIVFTGLYPGDYGVVTKYCGGRQTPSYGGKPGPGETYVVEMNLP